MQTNERNESYIFCFERHFYMFDRHLKKTDHSIIKSVINLKAE